MTELLPEAADEHDGAGARGVLTLPAEVRERYKIQEGDAFRPEHLDGILVLTPMVPELAREIERARLEAGLSVQEMLASLRKQRERYGQDRQDDV